MKKTKRQKTKDKYVGYKVVVVKGGKNYSCTKRVFRSDHRFSIRYLVNKWVFPFEKCGPLAVFGSLKNAEEFLKKFVDHWGRTDEIFRIYRCEYIPSRGQRLFVGRSDSRESTHLVSLPYDTRLARSVRLEKKCFEKRVR